MPPAAPGVWSQSQDEAWPHGPTLRREPPAHTRTCLSVEARLPEGPASCQGSRKRDTPTSAVGSQASRRGPGLGQQGCTVARLAGGEWRGAWGTRGHLAVRMRVQGRQRAGLPRQVYPARGSSWWEPVLGTGLGAEQEASQLSRAQRDLGHPPRATSGSTKSPHLGRQDGTWTCRGLPASVGLLGNARHLSSGRCRKPGRAGEGATLLPVPAWGPFPESLPIFSGALAVAMETPHPPQGAPALLLGETQPGGLLSQPSVASGWGCFHSLILPSGSVPNSQIVWSGLWETPLGVGPTPPLWPESTCGND